MSGVALPPQHDPLPAIKALLHASAPLVAAVTGGDVAPARAGVVRLYGESLPADPILSQSYPSVAAPAVVVDGAGGPHDPSLPVAHQRIELRAYATDTAAARALWHLALAALRADQLRLGNVVVYARGDSATPHCGPDPSGFPVAIGMVPFVVFSH